MEQHRDLEILEALETRRQIGSASRWLLPCRRRTPCSSACSRRAPRQRRSAPSNRSRWRPRSDACPRSDRCADGAARRVDWRPCRKAAVRGSAGPAPRRFQRRAFPAPARRARRSSRSAPCRWHRCRSSHQLNRSTRNATAAGPMRTNSTFAHASGDVVERFLQDIRIARASRRHRTASTHRACTWAAPATAWKRGTAKSSAKSRAIFAGSAARAGTESATRPTPPPQEISCSFPKQKDSSILRRFDDKALKARRACDASPPCQSTASAMLRARPSCSRPPWQVRPSGSTAARSAIRKTWPRLPQCRRRGPAPCRAAACRYRRAPHAPGIPSGSRGSSCSPTA